MFSFINNMNFFNKKNVENVDFQKKYVKNVNGEKKLFKNFTKVFHSLPLQLVNFLTTNPINFEFVSESEYLKEDTTGVYISSFTDGIKIILLQTDNNIELKEDLIHEIGHYFDATIGRKFINLSSEDLVDYESYFMTGGEVLASFFDKELRTIYEDEKKYFESNSYIHNSIEEFFAESFMEYYLYPLTFQESCPKMYDYINYYINQL